MDTRILVEVIEYTGFYVMDSQTIANNKIDMHDDFVGIKRVQKNCKKSVNMEEFLNSLGCGE